MPQHLIFWTLGLVPGSVLTQFMHTLHLGLMDIACLSMEGYVYTPANSLFIGDEQKRNFVSRLSIYLINVLNIVRNSS